MKLILVITILALIFSRSTGDATSNDEYYDWFDDYNANFIPNVRAESIEARNSENYLAEDAIPNLNDVDNANDNMDKEERKEPLLKEFLNENSDIGNSNINEMYLNTIRNNVKEEFNVDSGKVDIEDVSDLGTNGISKGFLRQYPPLVLKLKSLYFEEVSDVESKGRREEKGQPKLNSIYFSREVLPKRNDKPKPKQVRKRIFTLFTRHQSFPNSRKDFAHRRHFHQWLNGDFVSAETRTPLGRPPGSPLRWG